MIPDSRMFEGDEIALEGGKGIADKKLKPDSLQNRFGKDGGGLLPQALAPNPFSVGHWHRD